MQWYGIALVSLCYNVVDMSSTPTGRDRPLRPHAPQFIIAHFNPLSCNRIDRLEEISRSFSNYDVATLSGTQKCGNNGEIPIEQTQHHHVLHWGCSKGKHSNHSAGCSILLSKRKFRQQHMHQIYHAPPQMQGRVAAIRLRSGRFDILVMCLYFPPKPWDKQEWSKYSSTCKAILEWMDKVLSETPTRCSPFLCTDLNDCLKTQVGQQCVAPHAKGNQRETGRELQNLLAKHDMMAVNTFTDPSATYVGEKWESMIDFVCMATGMASNLVSCRVCHKQAKQLQAINTKKFRDHKPIELRVNYILECVPHVFEQEFDKEKLVQGLQTAKIKADFIHEVENKLMQHGPTLQEEQSYGCPDRGWDHLVDIVRECALNKFGKKPNGGHPEMAKMRKEITEKIKERKLLREQRDQTSSQDEDQIWKLSWEINRTSRKCKKIVKDRYQQKIARLERELEWALKSNQMHVAWNLCRMIGRTRNGPKKCRYGIACNTRPCVEQWKQSLARPGKEKGCSANPIDLESEINDHIQELEHKRFHIDMNNVIQANEDWYWIKRAMAKAPLRKASVPWDLPNEVWMMLSLPNRKMRAQKLGVGASEYVVKAPIFEKNMLDILLQIRSVQFAPLRWHVAQGYQIDKKNKLPGTQGIRIIFGLPNFGKFYFSRMFRKNEDIQSDLPNHAHGCRKYHAREDAMLVSEITSWKLRQQNLSHVSTLHDMTNAFLCSKHSVLDAFAQHYIEPKDAELIRQRHTCATVCMDCPDGEIALTMTEGGMVGDHGGPLEFMHPFTALVDAWHEHLQNIKANQVLARGIIDGEFVDSQVQITSYVDDIQTKHVFGNKVPTAQKIIKELQSANNQLNEILDGGGYAQNVSKQVVVPMLVGTKSRIVLKELLKLSKNSSIGNVAPVARYLETLQSADLTYGAEHKARLNAMMAGWGMMGSYWTSNTPFVQKRNVFVGIVQSAVLSAGSVPRFSNRQLSQFDSQMAKYLRVIM